MKSRSLIRARSSRALANAVLLCAPAFSMAGASFLSGSATWSWDADTNSTNGGKTSFTIAPPSSGSLPTNPTYQLNKTGSFGSATATGKGSIGYVANSTTASWTFSGGSGAGQNDPSDQLTGNTLTKVQFGGLYDVTSPSFGPTATGYFSLTAAGFAGINGSTEVDFNVQWRLGGPSGTLLRSQINDGTTFLGGGSGMNFSKTWTFCSAFSPGTVSASDSIWVGGFLTLAASNGGTPSEARPFVFEASAAPPTATFYGPDGTNSDWFDPASWAAPNNPAAGIFAFTEPGALVPAIPDGVGVRARIVNRGQELRGLDIGDSVLTLGALQIDDDSTLNIGGGSGSLVMDVNSGNASIFVGATAGRGTHGISVPIAIEDNLEIRVETDAPGTGAGSVLNISNGIFDNGNPKQVVISGGGLVAYSDGNFYAAGTYITDNGNLIVNAPGGLGFGGATVENGRLILNTSDPFQNPGPTITANAGGVVVLNTGTVGGNSASFAAGSGFTAPAALLGGITVNGASNIQLQPGAFVGHEVIDLSPAANPQGLGNVPLYVFAISADPVTLGSTDITVGSGSASPWIGFSSDGVDRTYGFDTFVLPVLTIAGTGRLEAIGGNLTLRGQLAGATSAVAQIGGSGVVSIEADVNDFSGEVQVLNGATLRVNGGLGLVQTITVNNGGLLGGDGNIGGNVIIQDGGRLDPGINKIDDAITALTVNNLTLNPESVLEFEFGEFSSDRVNVGGTLVLDGELLLEQLQDFDNQSLYTLFNYTGTIVDNGLSISPFSQDINGIAAADAVQVLIIPNLVGGGGVVVLSVVPEPGCGMLLAMGGGLLIRRRRA